MRPIYIALDFSSMNEVNQFLAEFEKENLALHLKVGMQLFYASKKEEILSLSKRGHHLFLDLKLHDIPNTVSSALKSLASIKPTLINVHASGGRAMLKAAHQAFHDYYDHEQSKLLGVTVLTSLSEDQLRDELSVSKSLSNQVLHLTKACVESGLDGVVCSPLELALIRDNLGHAPYLITPGIRLQENEHQDQKRVLDPKQAFELGANALVIGRPLTKASKPLHTYKEIIKSIKDEVS